MSSSSVALDSAVVFRVWLIVKEASVSTERLCDAFALMFVVVELHLLGGSVMFALVWSAATMLSKLEK
jgi:hypothetical protein